MNRKDFKELKTYQKIKVRQISSGEVFRAVKESEDNAFVYAKGMKRRGYRMMADTFCDRYDLVPEKDPGVVWAKRVAKAVSRLEKSGLWPEILEQFKDLQKVSYEDREEIKQIYWNLPWDNTRTEEDYKKIYGKFWDKYPFMFCQSGVIAGYLYGMLDAKTKSMYFGKYLNRHIKDRIAEALANRQKISEHTRAGYDVSFEYDPDRNKAWYSEEYRDCGNGHYYLAIDANTALFCEDD